MRRKYFYHYVAIACVVLYIYYFFGVSDYIYSKKFEKEFNYPLNRNIQPLVREVMLGRKPAVAPINIYPYRFLTNSRKCYTLEKLDLFIVVKTARSNFEKRNGIRQTYGQENSIPGRIIRVLFFIGSDDLNSPVQERLDREMAEFKDIIQMDFHDSYFNNTIKTMMSFRWLYEHCSNADYYLFTDDDMYISVKNLLDYVNDDAFTRLNVAGDRGDKDSVILDNDTEKIILAGYVFNSSPQRFRSSKWHVTLDEYPYDRWPPYVTAGAYVVSNRCMRIMYVGSLFVKHFRFDDIYLGIVAKKVGLEPKHCPKFYFYKKKYSVDSYRDVIASHGYDDPEELIRVWNEQNAL
ncbi:unnamed protein product [Euphydryas editha]|uniref:Hexosyltransferase n=1 Tax=Euphydryas editha TaxID=104508 RepID=A0AAU9V4S0_EUPED|nr:unnamed protein product [Euphydryas editha]